MKRYIGFIVAFVLGFAACALIFRAAFGDGELVTAGGAKIVNTTGRSSPRALGAGNNDVAKAAAIVERSVVNIDTVGKPIEGPGLPGFFGFGRPQEVAPVGQASGVIMRPDGYILTNNHVVADASKVNVTLSDGKRFPAKIVGRDPKTDLAVIKINQSNLPAASFASDNNLQVGDWVIAVGNALGLGATVTVGVVSATQRENLNIEGTTLEDAIQTDAAINRGNSGGALADINGTVVGINTAIASTSPGGGSIGIGFAIPSSRAVSVAEQIIENGKVIRPWIGISYGPYTDETRQELIARGASNLPKGSGAIIGNVMSGSPADRAGLMPLDVILEINGKKITDYKIIADEITKSKVGAIVDLKVWHARTESTSRIAIRTGEMPANL